MRRLKVTLLCTAASGLAALWLSASAHAQDQSPPDEMVDDTIEQVSEDTDEPVRVLDDIRITGSLLARSEYTSISPIEIITPDAAIQRGLVSTADMIHSSTLAMSAVQRNETITDTEAAGGLGIRTVDLRGCGDNRTLVVINGKRPGETGYSVRDIPAFNVSDIPASIIQRIEVLKDSGSTIYGSDAICGVVNIITHDSISAPQAKLSITQPFEQGGETLTLSGATGFELNANALFTVSAEYALSKELNAGDRDYLRCREDYVRDPDTGERIDRLNYSALATDPYDYCRVMSFYSIYDVFPPTHFVPTQDGSTIPSFAGVSIPGFQPLTQTGVSPDGDLVSYLVEYAPFLDSRDIRPQSERISLFTTSDITFGNGLNWQTQALYTHTKTETDGWRAFGPRVGSAMNQFFNSPGFAYPTDPTYSNALNRVVDATIPFPSLTNVESDFYFFSNALSGGFDHVLPGWSWNIDAIYSQSDTSLRRRRILAANSGDLRENGRDFTGDGVPDFTTPPALDYFSHAVLSAAQSDALVAAIAAESESQKSYNQLTVNAVASGDLFSLPAGDVLVAIGAEYREHETETRPDPLALLGAYHRSSPEFETHGKNKIAEVFAEIEVPILKGQPFAENVFLNGSVRAFDYDYGGSDHVYKIGLNWQITPTLRARTSHGTAYAAPTLVDQLRRVSTVFSSQNLNDPCVNWGLSSNQNIRDNCAAEGIPDDFTVGSSNPFSGSVGGSSGDIEVVQTVSELRPEQSTSYSIGLVYTPTWSDLNIAIDYYDIKIEDEISQLQANQIFYGCYAAVVFPNAYCDLIVRAPASAAEPFLIPRLETPYINIDSQIQRGIDVSLQYTRQLDVGEITVNSTISHPLERYRSVFGSDLNEGIQDLDRNGTIGFPKWVSSTTVNYTWQDWSLAWTAEFISAQDNSRYVPFDTSAPSNYYGRLGLYKFDTEAQFTHDVSIAWEGNTWGISGGIANLFDEQPPQISNNYALGSRYDSLGRRAFVNLSKRF